MLLEGRSLELDGVSVGTEQIKGRSLSDEGSITSLRRLGFWGSFGSGFNVGVGLGM